MVKIDTSKQKREMPPEAEYPGCIVGVYPLGMHQTKFGKKNRIALVVEFMCNGEKRTTHNTYTHYLGYAPDSTFQKLFESLRGVKIEENSVYDTDDLLMTPVMVKITHSKTNEGSYFGDLRPFEDEMIALDEAGKPIIENGVKKRVYRAPYQAAPLAEIPKKLRDKQILGGIGGTPMKMAENPDLLKVDGLVDKQ